MHADVQHPVGLELGTIEVLVDWHPEFGEQALSFEHALRTDHINPGEDVDAGIDFFREQAETLDSGEHGGLPVEAYVQLLDRLGRYEVAIDALLGFVQEQPDAASQAVPLMLELSQKAENFDKLIAYCRDRGDVLGYATAALCSAARE